MMRLRVSLTDREKRIAFFVAKIRDTAGQSAGANAAKYGNGMDTLLLHYTGCLGEMALAKGLNRFWSGAGLDYHHDDDVGGLQARATAHFHGRLLLRPDDASDSELPFFLLVGQKGDYDIVGWAFGYEVMQTKFLRAPNDRAPAFFYPQHLLKCITNKAWEDSNCVMPTPVYREPRRQLQFVNQLELFRSSS